MTVRFENTIQVSIPDIWHEVKKIPDVRSKLDPAERCRDQFLRCYRDELARCIREALARPEGKVVFSDLQLPSPDRKEDGQYIMQFEVFDLSKPRGNAYNWHGQNTSQWCYAGCVLYQDGRVSTHH